jgi:hypothetical protein
VQGWRRAGTAKVRADHSVAVLGDPGCDLVPLPPVLRESVLQNDGITVADSRDVAAQAGSVDDEVVEAGRFGERRHPIRCLGSGGLGRFSCTHDGSFDRAVKAGSTSNWFRTRGALLGGVVDWMAERERADFGGASVPEQLTPEAFIDGLCAVIELQSGPLALRTRARYALFLELASDPELGEPLHRQRHEFEQWTEHLVTATGIADPGPAARALMALGDGLMLHRLTVDPRLDVRPVIERSVRSLLASP